MDQFVSIRVRRRWLQVGAAIVLFAIAFAPASVNASHQFVDVPAGNVFHDDIAWLADSGITKGCNPPANDRFCPSAGVTREQMGAFMKRLATSQTVDAGTLAGQSASDLTSDAYSVWHDAAVQIPGTSTSETVLELRGLPEGSYLIMAKADIHNNETFGIIGECDLVAGTTLDRTVMTPESFKNVPIALTVVHTFDSDGTAQLRCTDYGRDSLVSWIKITAISLDTVTNTHG